MLEIPGDLLEFFFKEIKFKGKYEIDIRNNTAYIIPRKQERYYKPIIRIPNLDDFAILLTQYIKAMNEFNKKNGVKLSEHQDLSYALNIMLFNMAFSDAEDLNKFVETRTSFFIDNNFEEFIMPNKIFEYNDISYYAQREAEAFGLETPYIMTFSMKIAEELYNLPIIRYGISSDGVCYIYAVQIGKGRTCDVKNINYKSAVNPVNQGVKENRGISPSFVLILAIFLKMLNESGIDKIVIPDFLFNRYRKYYRANTINKSNQILSRMFHNVTTLISRMEDQIDGFNIQSYPLDWDSYYHININNLESNNQMLRKLLR